MKGRKLLSAIIAGAMVLGTMSFPVFAEGEVASIGDTTYTTLADAVAAAQNGDIVDLLGGTIVLEDTGVTTVLINKNITITNGTFDITDFEAAHSNSIFDIYDGAKVTFKDVDFTGSNYSSSYGVIYAHETSNVTLNNCDFKLDTEKDTATGGVLKGNDYAKDKFVVNNCNFTLNNTSRVFALMTIDMDGGSINATHKPISEEHAFRDVYGTIDDATISFDYFQNGIKNTENAALTFTNSTVSSTNMAEYDLQLAGGATVSGVAFDKTNCEATVSPAVTTFANTAAIGTTYYATLEDAFAAAQEGEVITLLADATPTLTSQRAITKASVIDLNGKTLTLTEYDLYFGTTTFKNGNIVVKPSVVAKTAVFWMLENQTLTFDNVDITATGVTGCYLMGTYDGTGTEIKLLNGTDIIIDNDTVSDLTAVIGLNGTDHNVTISHSNIDVNNIEGRFYLGCANGSVNVDNSAINLDGVKEGFYLRAGQKLDIAGTSNVNVKLNNTNGRYGINLTDATANYTVAVTATVNASIYKAPATDGSNLAKKVKLSFEATDKQEVYNIYAEAVDGTINRLSAVQVKFALNNPKMSYTLAPATDLGVTLTNDLDDEEAYVFNFNGEDAADATGVKLLIGTVTFGGYGDFNFTVDTNFNNKIKTAQTTDNIVEEYVPTPGAANEKQGTFDIASSAITGAEVVEAKRDVKVVIDFNNDITAGNDADYNNMWVTLTGSNGEVHTAQVGDLVDVLDDEGNVIGQAPNYTAEKAEMEFTVTAGYRYTVVVKGDGYRTARYSTNVDASDDTLVLTFWNNALEDADRTERFDYIEEGVERSKKSVTFLAGDIAQDNIIDKYDLAAVVSYFGFDNLKTTNPNYVKYDLNRDGKIDADDISYVLVSWGK